MLTTTTEPTSPAVQNRADLYDPARYDAEQVAGATYRVTHRSELVTFYCWKGVQPGTLIVDGRTQGGGIYEVRLGKRAAEHSCGCGHHVNRVATGKTDKSCKHVAAAVCLAAFCAARRVLARMAA